MLTLVADRHFVDHQAFGRVPINLDAVEFNRSFVCDADLNTHVHFLSRFDQLYKMLRLRAQSCRIPIKVTVAINKLDWTCGHGDVNVRLHAAIPMHCGDSLMTSLLPILNNSISDCRATLCIELLGQLDGLLDQHALSCWSDANPGTPINGIGTDLYYIWQSRQMLQILVFFFKVTGAGKVVECANDGRVIGNFNRGKMSIERPCFAPKMEAFATAFLCEKLVALLFFFFKVRCHFFIHLM